MKVDIYPSKVSGSICPPASKSFLHRAIISASLAKGTSIIYNVVFNQDVIATIDAFKSVGVDIKIINNSIKITSKGLSILEGEHEIDCNESGSTIRFLIPVLSNSKKAVFKGKTSLLARPMKIYEDIFKSQNLEYNITSDSITTIGKISPGKYVIPGNISSQFISGLMFILPTLSEDSTIEIVDDFESSNYVDMTISILESFSIIIKRTENGFFIKGNQDYKPTEIIAETDFSQLAFFSVLGTINSDIRIDNIDFTSLQPDKRIISIIEEMGGVVTKGPNYAIFSNNQTNGITIDVSQSPDIAPILTILAAKSLGTTKIINAKRLIIKESNRLLSSYETLKNFGVHVEMGEDNLTIYHTKKFNGGVFDSYNDHRIAMTIAIAATVADSKTTILNAEAVNKSYPDFYKDLESLGVKIKYY